MDRLSNNSMTEESDWSYASKQKLAVVKAIKGKEVRENACSELIRASRLSAKPKVEEYFLNLMQINLIFATKVLHLAQF